MEAVQSKKTFDDLMACILSETLVQAEREEEARQKSLEAHFLAEREATLLARERKRQDIERRVSEEAERQRQQEAIRARLLQEINGTEEVEHADAQQEAELARELEQRLAEAEAARVTAEARATQALKQIRDYADAQPRGAVAPAEPSWLRGLLAGSTALAVVMVTALMALFFSDLKPSGPQMERMATPQVAWTAPAVAETTEETVVEAAAPVDAPAPSVEADVAPEKVVAAAPVKPVRAVNKRAARKARAARLKKAKASDKAASAPVAEAKKATPPTRAQSFKNLNLDDNVFGAGKF